MSEPQSLATVIPRGHGEQLDVTLIACGRDEDELESPIGVPDAPDVAYSQKPVLGKGANSAIRSSGNSLIAGPSFH